MFHILLFEPEIPPNTGNIIRLCANTGCQLHLIGPLGFELDSASVRRAGLDYAQMAVVHSYRDLPQCLQQLRPGRLFAVETSAQRNYSQLQYQPQDAFMFGPETRGLPADVLASIPTDRHIGIPMRAANRSLNLSNAVAVVVYEAWRQQQFTAGPPPA